ncbi:MAG TPA: DUF6084 family protein [Nocardioidaceae bacterium]|nr:DUF6084 family protein [Nocardioidaceae bacterium]
MSSYTFTVLDVFAEPYAAAPQLTARLRVEELTGQTIHAIALRCQVRIEPQRRGYGDEEETGLRSIFGDRSRWADTLKPFLWMQCSTTVQGFTGLTEVDLALPCTYDFDVTASRYLHSLGEGTVPLTLLFSGTVFTRGVNGFGVEQVPWDCESRYLLPVAVWRQMMDLYYPGTGWIRLDRDVLQQLADYRTRHGLTTWDETVTMLLSGLSEASGGGR